MPERQTSGPHKEFTDMDATSKVETVDTSDSGLTPSTIPGGCNDAQNGVSVENVYVRKEGYAWYVFRADHGRSDKAYDLLKGLGIEVYKPRHTVYMRTPTGVKSTVKNMMPYFVLAYLTKYQSRLFTRGAEHNDDKFNALDDEDKHSVRVLNTLLSFYYDHCRTIHPDSDKNPPMIIPPDKMDEFLIATLTEKNVIPVDPGTFEVGEEVEVVVGEFKGLIGRVIRKENKKKRLYVQLSNKGMMVPPPYREREGRQRLYFQIPCLGSFGSAYIPTAYFKKIGAPK